MKPLAIFVSCLTFTLASNASTIANLRAVTVPLQGTGTLVVSSLVAGTSSPDQDYTAMAAIALGLPSDQLIKLDLAATGLAELPPLPKDRSNPVPEPATAIFLGSGILLWIVSRLRKRQNVFDYYNK
jgi:hypothetical protein